MDFLPLDGLFLSDNRNRVVSSSTGPSVTSVLTVVLTVVDVVRVDVVVVVVVVVVVSAGAVTGILLGGGVRSISKS